MLTANITQYNFNNLLIEVNKSKIYMLGTSDQVCIGICFAK